MTLLLLLYLHHITLWSPHGEICIFLLCDFQSIRSNLSNPDTDGAEEVSFLVRGVLISEVEMHARLVVFGVGKGVQFRKDVFS